MSVISPSTMTTTSSDYDWPSGVQTTRNLWSSDCQHGNCDDTEDNATAETIGIVIGVVVLVAFGLLITFRGHIRRQRNRGALQRQVQEIIRLRTNPPSPFTEQGHGGSDHQPPVSYTTGSDNPQGEAFVSIPLPPHVGDESFLGAPPPYLAIFPTVPTESQQ